MTNQSESKSDIKFSAWEGSSAFVQQGRHWSSAFIWLCTSLFTLSIIWLFNAKLDQTISIRGRLQPSGSVREIDSPSSGVVLNVYVADGDKVNVGDPLLTVESKGLIARRTALSNTLKLLNLEAASLQSIISSKGIISSFGPLPPIPDTTDFDFRQKLITSRNQTNQIRSQLKQLSIRLSSKIESLRLQELIASDLKPLYDSGGLARNAYLNQLNNLQELRAEVSTLEGERSRIIGATSSNLNNANRRILSLRSELASLDESLSYRTLKAPLSGLVFDLKAAPLSVVNNNEILLKIVPENRLVANVQIPNQDIGFVKPGLPVSVSVDSFPSGEFGYIKGALVSFGSDALSTTPGSPLQYFPGVVRLDQQSVMSGNTKLNLQSGMSVTANIKLRSRKAISLITDIFTKQLDGVKQFR